MYLPWDLASYGVEAPGYPVSRAVRASAAIPFMFEPVRLKSTFGVSTLADGSLLRSYPIEVFDRHDGKPSRWPTLGIRLSSPSSERAPAKPVTGPVSLIQSLIYTTVDSTQVRHVSDDADVDRSIFAKPRGRAMDRLRPHPRAAADAVRRPATRPARSGSPGSRTARRRGSPTRIRSGGQIDVR